MRNRKVNWKYFVVLLGCLLLAACANPVTEESYLGDTVETWNGRMGFWVRNNMEKGMVNIQVSTEDLEQTIEIYAG